MGRHTEDYPGGPVLLHFEGPWTQQEKTTLKQSIQKAETNGLPPICPELGTGWILTCVKVSENVSVYGATRQGLRDGFSATNPAKLARKIQETGDT